MEEAEKSYGCLKRLWGASASESPTFTHIVKEFLQNDGW